MNGRVGWIVWLALLTWHGAWIETASAQTPPFKHQMHPSVSQQIRFLDVRVVMGQISVSTDDPTRNFDMQGRQGDVHERLAIEFAEATLSLDYSLSTPACNYAIRVVDSREVIVRVDPSAGAEQSAILLVQGKSGAVELKIGSGESSRHIKSNSLWHVILAEPEIARQNLIPLLELLRPGWQLLKTAQDIEGRLASWSAPVSAIDAKAIGDLVDLLGNDSFSVREETQRRLVAMGPPVAPWLRSYGVERLDAEQRTRLRLILDTLGGVEEEDTPRGAAGWMASDPITWQLFLRRDDIKQRKLAHERLEKLLGREIPFDPAADESERAKQLLIVEKLLSE